MSCDKSLAEVHAESSNKMIIRYELQSGKSTVHRNGKYNPPYPRVE
ncbi:hypothetical protein EZS27_043183 [termite gut metagenome]|uniref:Uncharacterized protein n=1 Tax=termite gut metagenome TaxID=433724 RepID=A0A5J4P710_9ZZZZ